MLSSRRRITASNCANSASAQIRRAAAVFLVEATLFYDADGKLRPPQPDVVIVDNSEIDRAYTAAGIPHRVSSAEHLIRQGYCNPFLLKLVTPQERAAITERCERAAAVRDQDPRPSLPDKQRNAPPRSTPAPTVPPGRASARYDAEGIGRGPDPRLQHGGGFRMSGDEPRSGYITIGGDGYPVRRR